MRERIMQSIQEDVLAAAKALQDGETQTEEALDDIIGYLSTALASLQDVRWGNI